MALAAPVLDCAEEALTEALPHALSLRKPLHVADGVSKLEKELLAVEETDAGTDPDCVTLVLKVALLIALEVKRAVTVEKGLELPVMDASPVMLPLPLPLAGPLPEEDKLPIAEFELLGE